MLTALRSSTDSRSITSDTCVYTLCICMIPLGMCRDVSMWLCVCVCVCVCLCVCVCVCMCVCVCVCMCVCVCACVCMCVCVCVCVLGIICLKSVSVYVHVGVSGNVISDEFLYTLGLNYSMIALRSLQQL